MMVAQPVTFFVMRFCRLPCIGRWVSVIVVCRSGRGAQHVVVDALIEGHHRRVEQPIVAAHEGVDDLPHRQDHPAQRHQRLAQLEGATLHVQRPWPRVEQEILQALQLAVELLDGGEMAVDNEVQEPYSRNPTPCFARSEESSQRDTTWLMSKRSSLRTVISARLVRNTATSLV